MFRSIATGITILVFANLSIAWLLAAAWMPVLALTLSSTLVMILALGWHHHQIVTPIRREMRELQDPDAASR